MADWGDDDDFDSFGAAYSSVFDGGGSALGGGGPSAAPSLSDDQVTRELWPLYFHGSQAAEDSDEWMTVSVLVNDIRTELLFMVAETSGTEPVYFTGTEVPIDVGEVRGRCEHGETIEAELVRDPQKMIAMFGLALAVVRHNNEPEMPSRARVGPRFFNLSTAAP